MNKRSRPTFSPEFRLEAAQLVVDHGRTMNEAAEAMGVGKSTMDKWVRQLREERRGNQPGAKPYDTESAPYTGAGAPTETR